MDYAAIERSLIEKTKTIYQDFQASYPPISKPKLIGKPGAREEQQRIQSEKDARDRALSKAKGRVGVALAHVRSHRAWLADRSARLSEMNGYIESLRSAKAALAAGKRLMAFDVERGWRASTTVVRALKKPSRVLRVDDITGFEPGWTLWVGDRQTDKTSSVRKPGRYVLTEVRPDSEDLNISERERGSSGDLVFATKVMPFDAPARALVTGLCQTREIGYTTLQNGVMESFNLRSTGTRRTSWVGFQFGQTELVAEDDIIARIVSEAAKASYIVGHSIGMDMDHIREHGGVMPRRPILDTFMLASLIPEFNGHLTGANLGALAAYYGIYAPKPHSGGNDSRYTMEVLLAMIDAYA